MLIADSAVTRPETARTRSSNTSFGEASIKEGGKSVTESALKIRYLPMDCAFTFAGEVSLGNDVENLLRQLLTDGMPPADALRRSLISVTPLKNPNDLQCILAWHDGTSPQLSSFNTHNDGRIANNQDVVQIGSMPDDYKVVVKLIAEARNYEAYGADEALAIFITLCQSFGANNYLLESGVGGVFSGVALSKNERVYHPDIAYVFITPNSINASRQQSPNKVEMRYVGIRNEVQCVCTDLADDSGSQRYYFANTDSNEIDHESRLNQAIESFETDVTNFKPSFFVVFNTQLQNVAIINIKNNSNKDNIIFKRQESDNDKKVNFEISMSDHISKIVFSNQRLFHYQPEDGQ